MLFPEDAFEIFYLKYLSSVNGPSKVIFIILFFSSHWYFCFQFLPMLSIALQDTRLSTVQFHSHLRNYVKKRNQKAFRDLKHTTAKIKPVDELSRRMAETEGNYGIRNKSFNMNNFGK